MILRIRITGASNNKEMIKENMNDSTAFPRNVVNCKKKITFN